MGGTLRAAFATPGTRPALDLKIHQPLRGERDHFAQQIGIGALLQERLEGHYIAVIVGSLVRINVWRPKSYRRSTMTTAVDSARCRQTPGGRGGRLLIHRSYTTPRDTTPDRPEAGRPFDEKR